MRTIKLNPFSVLSFIASSLTPVRMLNIHFSDPVVSFEHVKTSSRTVEWTRVRRAMNVSRKKKRSSISHHDQGSWLRPRMSPKRFRLRRETTEPWEVLKLRHMVRRQAFSPLSTKWLGTEIRSEPRMYADRLHFSYTSQQRRFAIWWKSINYINSCMSCAKRILLAFLVLPRSR